MSYKIQIRWTKSDTNPWFFTPEATYREDLKLQVQEIHQRFFNNSKGEFNGVTCDIATTDKGCTINMTFESREQCDNWRIVVATDTDVDLRNYATEQYHTDFVETVQEVL